MTIKQWWCGRKYLGRGHRMDVNVTMTEDTYVIDPIIECTRCGINPPQEVYDQVIARVDEMRR